VATLTPSFQEILPAWIARQPWYAGAGVPALRPVGFYRLEDPAGQVGIDTHLVTDGAAVYQIAMTYRGAPLERLADGTTDPASALIAEAVVVYRVWPPEVAPAIELVRVVAAGPPDDGPDVLGAVAGSWHPAGPDGPAAEGCLAVLRAAPAPA
jgi:maltokinase-like protein